MGIDGLIERMAGLLPGLPDGHPRRLFHTTYLRTTEAVRDRLRTGGFVDPDWVEQWDVVFAGLYLDALEAWLDGRPIPQPWAVAFGAGADDAPRLPPVRHVLLGMNAHINFDLPQALLAVIADDEFDQPDLLARRRLDHGRIDEVLAARVAAEDRELRAVELPGDRTLLDRLLVPVSRRATRRFLAESRRKVWSNTVLLAESRRAGRLPERVGELEGLAAARVADLMAPGQVIIELGRRGFGVELPA